MLKGLNPFKSIGIEPKSVGKSSYNFFVFHIFQWAFLNFWHKLVLVTLFLQPQSQQIPFQAVSLQYLREWVICGQMNLCLYSQVNYFLLWDSAEPLHSFYGHYANRICWDVLQIVKYGFKQATFERIHGPRAIQL